MCESGGSRASCRTPPAPATPLRPSLTLALLTWGAGGSLRATGGAAGGWLCSRLPGLIGSGAGPGPAGRGRRPAGRGRALGGHVQPAQPSVGPGPRTFPLLSAPGGLCPRHVPPPPARPRDLRTIPCPQGTAHMLSRPPVSTREVHFRALLCRDPLASYHPPASGSSSRRPPRGPRGPAFCLPSPPPALSPSPALPQPRGTPHGSSSTPGMVLPRGLCTCCSRYPASPSPQRTAPLPQAWFTPSYVSCGRNVPGTRSACKGCLAGWASS